MKRLMTIGLGLLGVCFLGAAQADDLLTVYKQAVQNDPTFAQAESTWWSAKQDLPISVAAYLPQLTIADTGQKVYADTTGANGGAGTPTYGYMQNVLGVTATQAIFNYTAWTNIREQSANVKSATATYFASIQSLMQRTVTAYLNVLSAYDALNFTLANKAYDYRQLVTAQQQFKVGLIAITGVYDAQSSYDQAVAAEITDRNTLYNQLENLRAITGQRYMALQGISDQVPLITPVPNDIDQWVQIADSQNYTLQAANYAAVAAHEAVSNAAASYYPIINAVGGISNTTNVNSNNPAVTANQVSNGGTVGLSATWTPFSGGSTYYTTRQERYNYLTALGALDFAHRNTVNQTRQAFLGVITGISSIQADKQTIISAQNALKATQAGYLVGTRTMADVLQYVTTLYSAKNTYMQDQYAYINNIIQLKLQAGTLSMNDLVQINTWLKKQEVLPLPTDYYKGTSS